MALYVKILINDETIHTFGAQSLSGKKSGMGTYRLCKYVPDGKGKMKRVYLSGVIAHEYEDGAIVLAKKVLEAALWMDTKQVRKDNND
jgi:hypothetical protein